MSLNKQAASLPGPIKTLARRLCSQSVHYLIDLENIDNHWEPILDKLKPCDTIHVFYSSNACKLECGILKACSERKVSIVYIECGCGNSNALDFQLDTMLGAYIEKYPKHGFIIVSNDHGFSYVADLWSRHGKNVATMMIVAPEVKPVKPMPVKKPAKNADAKQALNNRLSSTRLAKNQVQPVCHSVLHILKSKTKEKDVLSDFHRWCQKQYGPIQAPDIYRKAKPAIQAYLAKDRAA